MLWIGCKINDGFLNIPHITETTLTVTEYRSQKVSKFESRDHTT